MRGSIEHVGRWLASTGKDLSYNNPNRHENADVSIYCVHGTADRPGAFSFIIQQLLAQLPVNIICIHSLAFDKRGLGTGIPYFAQQLKEKIIKNGDHKVILISHSRGGLVSAYFAEFLAQNGDEEIEVLMNFTLGTPFGGSSKASLFSLISESCAQMLPESDFLKMLSVKLKTSTIPYYFFAAEYDELVPLASTYIPGREENLIILKEQTHLSLMSCNELAQHLQNRFSNQPTTLSLHTLKQEVEDYITEFKCKKHIINNRNFKVKILKLLMQYITDLIAGNSNKYPSAKNAGEFICDFLADDKILRPISGNALSRTTTSIFQAVNLPLNQLIQLTNCTTANFLKGLCIRYNNISLNRE